MEFKINTKKKILFVSYGGGHINMVIPLYKRLAKSGNYEQQIMALTTAQAKLKNENIPFISYRDFIEEYPLAQQYGEKLSASQPNHPSIDQNETIAYLGLNFSDLVEKNGEATAFQMYQKEGRFSFFPTEFMKKVLMKVKPDIVVATNSPRSERASLVAAKQLGIASLCMADLFDRKDMLPLAEYDLGTKVSVLNNYAKSMLVEMGRKPEEIIVTGNPAFDRINDESYKEKSQTYRQKHSLDNQTTILWARSALAEDLALSEKIEQKLINLALSHPQYTVIIRPHPNDPDTVLEKTAPNLILSEKTDDIYTLVHASDIVYTLYSSVGLEAALIGKRVLQQTNTRVFNTFNLVDLDYAYGIDNVEQLNQVFAHIMSNPLPKSINTNRQLVNATDNIVDLIESLVR